jgi:hypothetical protein
MNRPEFLTNIVIGGVGAGGQALLLTHCLDSYPFVILISPPARFYSSVGLILDFVSPLLSLLALYLFRSTIRPFVTAIPVVACPLLFWLIFRLVFSVSGYHYANPSTRSDLIATKSVEDGFATLVLWLTFEGLVVGVFCGLFISLLFKHLRGPKAA